MSIYKASMSIPEDNAALNKARNRYEMARVALMGLLVTIVLVSLGILLLGLRSVHQQQNRLEEIANNNGEQAKKIQVILDTQRQNSLNRNAIIDDAIRRVNEAQLKALLAHDAAMETRLEQLLAKLSAK